MTNNKINNNTIKIQISMGNSDLKQNPTDGH